MSVFSISLSLLVYLLLLAPSLGLRAPRASRRYLHSKVVAHASDKDSGDDSRDNMGDIGIDASALPGLERIKRIADLSGAASGIFSSYRIPAALLAGAAYGGTFSMPLIQSEDLSKQLIKRTYVVIGLATVCAELLAVVVSTCAIDKIAVGDKTDLIHPTNSSLREYLDSNFELEWVSLRVNFILGLLGFCIMAGLRAWCFLSCPVFSRVSIGIIATSIFLVLAMMTEALTTSRDLVHLSQRYASLIWRRMVGLPKDAKEMVEGGKKSNFLAPWKERVLFVTAGAIGAITLTYTAWAYAHVIEFFMFNGLPWEEKVKKGWMKALHFGGGQSKTIFQEAVQK